MAIPEKELENVVKLDAFERYSYFLGNVAETEELCTLKKEGQWALAEIDDNKFFSVWSDPDYARLNMTGAWSDYEIITISLDDFLDEVLDYIRQNNYLINVFSIDNKAGFVVTADELQRDIEEELDQFMDDEEE